jgi:hypothetical protein
MIAPQAGSSGVQNAGATYIVIAPQAVAQTAPAPLPATAPAPTMTTVVETSEPPVCAACESSGDYWHLIEPRPWLHAGGWIDGGTIYNPANPPSKFNGPFNVTDRDEPALNQAYLFLEKPLDTSCGFGWGFRADAFYGTNYRLPQSLGWELTPNGNPGWNPDSNYGVTVPQLYGEVGYGDWSLKVGHFYALRGYERVQTTENFFYTYSYAFQFAGPFTHWGGLASWKPSSTLSVDAGVVNGWDALDRDGYNAAAFVGRVRVASDDQRDSLSFSLVTGKENSNPSDPAGGPAANRTQYSLVYDTQWTKCFEYVFEHELGWQNQGFNGNATAYWYGVTNYAFYTLSDCWRVGLRAEWFRDDQGTRVGLYTQPSNPNKPPLPGNFYEITLGTNYSPNPNVLIRPGVRFDFYSGSAKPFDDGTKNNQILFGVDAILRF